MEGGTQNLKGACPVVGEPELPFNDFDQIKHCG